MRFVLTGGGTAGHIYPALALAEELQDQGHEVFFAGTPAGIEARLAPEAGLPFKAFVSGGFNRNHPLTLPKSLIKIVKSTALAKKWFKEIKPDCVVGFGGYVSIPLGRAAVACKIPLVVHEQNSVMGMTNVHLAKRAQKVCLTYEKAAEKLSPNTPWVLTGNPVRRSVLASTKEQGRAYLGIPKDAQMLLIFGGSLGAQHINNAVAQLKEKILTHDNLYVVHVSGNKEYERVRELLNLTPEEEERWKLFAYQDRMGEVLAAADMVVSRAGATSLAEITARALPALLVPFPWATADHQTANAASLLACSAAFVVADNQVESELFEEKLMALIENHELRASMSQAAASLKTQDAAQRLAQEVLSCVKAQ